MKGGRLSWWVGIAVTAGLLVLNGALLWRHSIIADELLRESSARWRLWGDLWLRRWSWQHGLDRREASYLRGVLDDFSLRCTTFVEERERGLLDRWNFETLLKNEEDRCAWAAEPVLGEELARDFAAAAVSRCR